MERARYFLAGLIIVAGGIGLESHAQKVGEYQVRGGCRTSVFEIKEFPVNAGITLPDDFKGDTFILVQDKNTYTSTGMTSGTLALISHEEGHAQQYCKRGSLQFLIDYLTQSKQIEADASARGLEIGGQP